MTLGVAIPITLIVTLLLVLITLALMAKNGHIIVLKGIKILGLNFETRHFETLTAFYVFRNISMAQISPELILENQQIDPILLIHCGWSLVADAYIHQFGEYPDGSSLQTRSKELGSQNTDFIRQFRDVYSQAAKVQKSSKIPMTFAKDYFHRCPSLAQRIQGGVYVKGFLLKDELYTRLAKLGIDPSKRDSADLFTYFN